MRILLYTALLLMLAACASPYYPVPVSGDGNYYIAERQSGGSYYRTNSILYGDLGVHPWWMNSYPVELFSYYSPNYYPHYFSVWQPRGFHPFYGYYGRYYAYWCPPYRPRVHHEYSSGDRVVASPVSRPPSIVTYPSNAELRRMNDLAIVNRGTTGGRASYSRSTAWPTGSSPGSLPVYGRSSASPYSSGAVTRSSGRSNAGARSSAPRTARPIYGKPYATHKQ